MPMSFKKPYTLFFVLIFPFVLNASNLSKMYIEGNGKRLRNAILPQDTLDANGLQAAMIRIITDMKGSLKFDSNRGIIGSNVKPGQTDIFLSKHTRQIKIFKEGFEPLEVILSDFGVVLEEGAVFELKLVSDKKKDIVIISEPSDAEKIIDGKSIGKAKSLKLPFGKHTLTLKKEGYRIKHIKIEIDDTTTLLQGEQFKLEEIEPTVLKIDSSPQGAKVFINEQDEGITPYGTYKFPAVYKLRIIKNGYMPIEKKIEIKDDQNTFFYNLTKNASYINLKVVPSDATVFVNNIEQKVINNRIELAPATYKIEIKKQGYDSASKVVSLKLKDEIDLNFTLKEQQGKLQFSVNPANANISLLKNNQEIEKWQGLKYLKNLPVGEYEIVAKQEGYKTYKKKILIEKDKLNKFTAVLEEGEDIEFNGSDSDFSFTKISEDGKKLPKNAQNWSCVLDNKTGLMWEVKKTNGFHDQVTREEAFAFANQTNKKTLCGYNDWRVPTPDELISIVDYSRHSPAIDTKFFPNTKSSYYLSSLVYAYFSISDKVCRLDFDDGGNNWDNRNDSGYVRLVHSLQ